MISKATIVILFLFTSFCFAKVWRVDMNSANKPDFTYPQQAVDDSRVASGDTIYLAGHSNHYGNLILDKGIVLIGNGYLLKENDFNYGNFFSSRIGLLTINSGAANSVIRSIEITDRVNINADGIIFDRNFVAARGIQSGGNNCFFSRNIIKGRWENFITYYALYIGGHNIEVKNNYLEGIGTNAFYSNVGSTCTITNNIFKGQCSFGGGISYNNIFVEGSFDLAGNVNADVRRNISSNNSLENFLENQSNVLMTDVFLYNDSPDGQWQLKTGSPAIGYGINGEDCGMFGGEEPYIISGIPPIPTIYDVTIPNSATQQEGLKVILKAKTNK